MSMPRHPTSFNQAVFDWPQITVITSKWKDFLNPFVSTGKSIDWVICQTPSGLLAVPLPSLWVQKTPTLHLLVSAQTNLTLSSDDNRDPGASDIWPLVHNQRGNFKYMHDVNKLDSQNSQRLSALVLILTNILTCHSHPGVLLLWQRYQLQTLQGTIQEANPAHGIETRG